MKTTLMAVLLMTGVAAVAHAAPVYYPTGPQTGVSLATVTGGGWTQCYAATMDVYIGDQAENVLNVCTGDLIMMAGRETGSDTFLVLAAAELSDATFDTGMTSNTNLANGSNWWFSPNWSWGFTAAGDTVTNNQCDTSDSPTSMCLHTVNNAGGYRINNITGLNSSTQYEKVFFMASQVPEPATAGLMALALAGFAAARRRRVN
jgi:hypothetical protein